MYLIVANWKMNPQTQKEAELLFNLIKKGVGKIKNVEVVICPPYVYLSQLRKKNKELNVKLGAQDCFWEKNGPFTGEISPLMLKDLGIEYVILGHSERRKFFGETAEMINKKIKAVLEIGLKPILCLGETKKERKEGKTKKVIANQLKKLPRVGSLRKLIFAYEPIWAIGSGRACGIEEAKKILRFFRKKFKNNPILYGGSVNSENAKDYIKKAGFQGLLVGGASLNAEEFIKIIKKLTKPNLIKSE